MRRQVQRRLTLVQQEAVATAYVAGRSGYSLAEEYGIERRTVAAILRRQGVQTRYRTVTDEILAEATRLYGEGQSLAAIGRRFGVDAGTVLNAFRKAGVPTRPKGWNFSA